MIREQAYEDIRPTVILQAETWQATYKGILPDDYLHDLRLNVDLVTERVESRFGTKQNNKTLVIEEQGQLVGFSIYGPCRQADSEHVLEIYALYIAKSHQGQGLGRQVVGHILEKVRESSYSSLVIWALKDNPHRHFYRKLGGRVCDEKEIVIGGQSFLELSYMFDDLDALRRQVE